MTMARPKHESTRACLIGKFFAVRYPLFFQVAPWACRTCKAYLESVKTFTLLFSTNPRALVSAINSAFWVEVPEGKDLASIVWRLTAAHLALLTPCSIRVARLSVQHTQRIRSEASIGMW